MRYCKYRTTSKIDYPPDTTKKAVELPAGSELLRPSKQTSDTLPDMTKRAVELSVRPKMLPPPKPEIDYSPYLTKEEVEHSTYPEMLPSSNSAVESIRPVACPGSKLVSADRDLDSMTAQTGRPAACAGSDLVTTTLNTPTRRLLECPEDSPSRVLANVRFFESLGGTPCRSTLASEGASSDVVPRRTRAAVKGTAWSEGELQKMARLEMQLTREGCPNINSSLADALQTRSRQQIQSRRARPDYQAMRDALRNEAHQWICTECDKTVVSKSGLGVHRSAMHPAAANLDRIVKTAKVKGRWSQEEDWILAREIWKDKEISNTALSSLLPGRTIEAVKKRMRYKAVTNLITSFGDPPPLPDSEGSKDEEPSSPSTSS